MVGDWQQGGSHAASPRKLGKHASFAALPMAGESKLLDPQLLPLRRSATTILEPSMDHQERLEYLQQIERAEDSQQPDEEHISCSQNHNSINLFNIDEADECGDETIRLRRAVAGGGRGTSLSLSPNDSSCIAKSIPAPCAKSPEGEPGYLSSPFA